MRPWGLPPRYAVYPIELLARADVPNHLKITYLTLYALAWRNEYALVRQSMAQLAEVFSALEGKPLTERGMRKRMGDLAALGLVRRVAIGGRWVTRLLLCHDTEAASTGTGSATLALPGVTSIVVNDDDLGTTIHQHQDYRGGTANATPEIAGPVRRELWSMGIAEPTAGELAEMAHVTEGYIEDWAAYLGYERAGGKKLGTGWLIEQIRAGRPAPVLMGEERGRF